MQHIEDIDSSIIKLEQCEYNSAVMVQVLEDVQKVVDKLNLRSYTNLSKWVQKLDTKVCWWVWSVVIEVLLCVVCVVSWKRVCYYV